MPWLVIWWRPSMAVLTAKSLVLLLHVTWFIANLFQWHGDVFLIKVSFSHFILDFWNTLVGLISCPHLEGESLGAKSRTPWCSSLVMNFSDCQWSLRRRRRPMVSWRFEGLGSKNWSWCSKKNPLFEWEAIFGWFWWYLLACLGDLHVLVLAFVSIDEFVFWDFELIYI